MHDHELRTENGNDTLINPQLCPWMVYRLIEQSKVTLDSVGAIGFTENRSEPTEVW